MLNSGWRDKNLIIVSNRLPITVTRRKGKLNYRRSTGGLVTGLEPIRKEFKSVIWIGWPGISSEKLSRSERDRLAQDLEELGLKPIFLTAREIDLYYHGFCNRTVWPLFHYFLQYVEYDEAFWRGYVKVNRKFGEAVLSIYRPGDIIWIHDYHLMLLPQMIREKAEEPAIGFFLHVPFPSYELLRTLPWRSRVLEGILGADLIGFHTYSYVRHFLSSVRRILKLDYALGRLNVDGRTVRVDAFPLGIDYESFVKALRDEKVEREYEKLRKRVESRKVILSLDRLDYTKGIPEKLRAFETFLRKHPEFREKVVLVLAVSPSRVRLRHYLELKREVDGLVGSINGEFTSFGRVPIHYIYRYLSSTELYALYRLADVALITPLRDGMNLVSKEFLAAKEDNKGVLIISELTGSASELTEAIIINPYDREGVSDAIYEALTMPEEEQRKRLRVMQERVRKNNAIAWAESFIGELAKVRKEQEEAKKMLLTGEEAERIVRSFEGSERRLIFLDYDGTLVPLAKTPDRAKPDGELLTLLKRLTEVSEVVIVSGRRKEDLERWFGDLELGLVAEHGAFIRMKEDKGWEPLVAVEPEWKDEIKRIFDYFVYRTPGSLMEEKESSLAWHYKQVEPELGFLRAAELKETLKDLADSYNLSILEGNRVIEVRPSAVSKGVAAKLWLNDDWDFILGAGDDWTDEDLFEALPPEAYSIRVGIGPTKAKYLVKSHEDVRSLLNELIKSAGG